MIGILMAAEADRPVMEPFDTGMIFSETQLAVM